MKERDIGGLIEIKRDDITNQMLTIKDGPQLWGRDLCLLSIEKIPQRFGIFITLRQNTLLDRLVKLVIPKHLSDSDRRFQIVLLVHNSTIYFFKFI